MMSQALVRMMGPSHEMVSLAIPSPVEQACTLEAAHKRHSLTNRVGLSVTEGLHVRGGTTPLKAIRWGVLIAKKSLH